jgi:hypothetical protein
VLVLAAVAKQPDESSVRITALEICLKLFLDEGGNAGIRIVRIAEALDEVVEVGLDQRMQQSISRTSWLVSPGRLCAPSCASATAVPSGDAMSFTRLSVRFSDSSGFRTYSGRLY